MSERKINRACNRTECHAYFAGTKGCIALDDTDFGERSCPFFKTREQAEKDKIKAAQRVAALSGVRPEVRGYVG